MENKYRKLLFKILSVVLLMGASASVAVDWALNGGITWSAFPLYGAPALWIISAPILLPRKPSIPLILLTLTAVTFPLLYFLSGITPVTGWFMGFGMPVAAIGLAISWVVYLVFKYLKINVWHKATIALFLYGVILSSAVRYFLVSSADSGIIGGLIGSYNINDVISIISTSVITVILFVIGLGKRPAVTVSSAGGNHN